MTFPRWVHKTGGETLLVASEESFAQAARAGWSAEPVAMRVSKGDETTAVYTAEALAVALAQGWALVVEAPKKAKK